jgi:hypothetical protein
VALSYGVIAKNDVVAHLPSDKADLGFAHSTRLISSSSLLLSNQSTNQPTSRTIMSNEQFSTTAAMAELSAPPKLQAEVEQNAVLEATAAAEAARAAAVSSRFSYIPTDLARSHFFFSYL